MSCNTIKKECYYTDEVKFKRMLNGSPESFNWVKLYNDKIIPESLIISYIKRGCLEIDKLESINNYDEIIFKYVMQSYDDVKIKYILNKFNLNLIMSNIELLSHNQLKNIESIILSQDLSNITINNLMILHKYNYISHIEFYDATCINFKYYVDNKSIFLAYMHIISKDRLFYLNSINILKKYK